LLVNDAGDARRIAANIAKLLSYCANEVKHQISPKAPSNVRQ
jgi:hypothetical protein